MPFIFYVAMVFRSAGILMPFGIILFTVVVFHLVNLPVEFNASRRHPHLDI